MFTDKQILAVDDSVAIRNYLRSLLTRQGAHVDITGMGAEGVTMSQENQYDLILLDLMLPDISGLDVLQSIRKEDDAVTVVILTGAGGVKTAISAVQHGADAYLEKQDIASADGLDEFFYTLKQAMERRAGVVAQKQLMQIKSDFYSMVTHDLRNPAGYIQIAVQMLEMMLINPVDTDLEERDELIEIIKQSANKMLGLITDYLDFSKIEAGYLKLKPDWAELTAMAEKCVHLAKIQIHARHQTLEMDLPADPIQAWVDVKMLRQVLDNLLSNAIKYTPEGGTITLHLSTDGEQAVFEVRDTGMGIPPDQIPALFAKYHRVPGESSNIQGTGLGLMIVKEIVMAHDGTVSAFSEGVPGKGTTFRVQIPLTGRPEWTAQPPTELVIA